MHRIFCRRQFISGDVIKVTDNNEVHHARDVLRMKPQDKIMVFDEDGNEYSCFIKSISKELILGIYARHAAKIRPQGVSINIACAIPKKDKMDNIVDKLTQLGVERIIPLRTERVIIRLDKNKESLRIKRWEKIALSAAKQSRRNSLPVVGPVREIKEFINSEHKRFDLKIIPTLGIDVVKPLKTICENTLPKSILVLIGPEGDFTDEEVALAKKSGFLPANLGGLVLRVEAAAVAVASFLRLYYGQDG